MRKLAFFALAGILIYYAWKVWFRKPSALEMHIQETEANQRFGMMATNQSIAITPPIATVGEQPLTNAILSPTVIQPPVRNTTLFRPTAGGTFARLISTPIDDLLTSLTPGAKVSKRDQITLFGQSDALPNPMIN